MKKFKSFIIAEVGVNHNGNIEIAKKLINLAKKADCEFVKFQSFKASNLVNQRTRVAKYQKNNLKKKNIKQIDMLKKYQLSYDDHDISHASICNPLLFHSNSCISMES